MKSLIKIVALFLIVSTATLNAPLKAEAPFGVSIQIFFDQLSPYGQWVNYPGYGYGWIPAVGADFSPYATAGHWVFTDYGWTWVSDYTWGWAAFHYGRWNYDPYYGWIWLPDNVWGPAWVSWRQAPGYYGWAPLGYGLNYYNDYDRWTFCGEHNFGDRKQDRYYIDASRKTTIINNSTVINNTYVDRGSNTSYASGPDAAQVQRRSGRSIERVSLQESNTPGEHLSNNSLSIYKPRVSQSNNNGRTPAPSNVTDISKVGSRSERNSSFQQQSMNRANGNDRNVNLATQDNNSRMNSSKVTADNNQVNRINKAENIRNDQSARVQPQNKNDVAGSTDINLTNSNGNYSNTQQHADAVKNQKETSANRPLNNSKSGSASNPGSVNRTPQSMNDQRNGGSQQGNNRMGQSAPQSDKRNQVQESNHQTQYAGVHPDNQIDRHPATHQQPVSNNGVRQQPSAPSDHGTHQRIDSNQRNAQQHSQPVSNGAPQQSKRNDRTKSNGRHQQ